MKPLGNRALLKIDILVKKDDQGNEYTDLSREAKVVESNVEGVKKGDKVYYNPRGCVEVELLRTKKNMVVCVDGEDIYVLL